MTESGALKVLEFGNNFEAIHNIKLDQIQLDKPAYPLILTYSLPDGTQTTHYQKMINNQ